MSSRRWRNLTTKTIFEENLQQNLERIMSAPYHYGDESRDAAIIEALLEIGAVLASRTSSEV